MIYNKKDNYCSMSPDRILGVLINHSCYLHDRHYRNERKIRKTRKEADILLKDLIYEKLKTSNNDFELRFTFEKFNIDWLFFKSNKKIFISFRKKLAYPISKIYYYAVRLFARRYWR